MKFLLLTLIFSITFARSTFASLYEEKYGELPTNPFIGEGFDGAILLALAMAKSGSDTVDGDSLRFVANAPGEKVGPGDMAKALELLKDGKDIDYVGVAGEQEIDENGDVLTLALFEELTPGVRLIALDTKEIVFEREKESLVVINFKNQIKETNK